MWGGDKAASDARTYLMERIVVEDRGYSTPCWTWQLSKNKKGYGRTAPDTARFGERRVHRIAYIAFKSPIPSGLTIDHLCGVKSCCNPDHLEPVDAVENFLRWSRSQPRKPRPPRKSLSGHPGTGRGGWQRFLAHCKHGHEYTPENTKLENGARRCRECRRIQNITRGPKRNEARRLARIAKRGRAEQGPAASYAQIMSLTHDRGGI